MIGTATSSTAAKPLQITKNQQRATQKVIYMHSKQGRYIYSEGNTSENESQREVCLFYETATQHSNIVTNNYKQHMTKQAISNKTFKTTV